MLNAKLEDLHSQELEIDLSISVCLLPPLVEPFTDMRQGDCTAPFSLCKQVSTSAPWNVWWVPETERKIPLHVTALSAQAHFRISLVLKGWLDRGAIEMHGVIFMLPLCCCLDMQYRVYILIRFPWLMLTKRINILHRKSLIMSFRWMKCQSLLITFLGFNCGRLCAFLSSEQPWHSSNII